MQKEKKVLLSVSLQAPFMINHGSPVVGVKQHKPKTMCRCSCQTLNRSQGSQRHSGNRALPLVTCTGSFCMSANGSVASRAVTSFTFLSKAIISEWLSKNLPITMFSRMLLIRPMFSCTSTHTRACDEQTGRSKTELRVSMVRSEVVEGGGMREGIVRLRLPRVRGGGGGHCTAQKLVAPEPSCRPQNPDWTRQRPEQLVLQRSDSLAAYSERGVECTHAQQSNASNERLKKHMWPAWHPYQKGPSNYAEASV